MNVRLVGDAVMALTTSVTGMTNGLLDAWGDIRVMFPLYEPAERPDENTYTETDPGVVPFGVITLSH